MADENQTELDVLRSDIGYASDYIQDRHDETAVIIITVQSAERNPGNNVQIFSSFDDKEYLVNLLLSIAANYK